jgi:YVTN family beta-propeller protein
VADEGHHEIYVANYGDGSVSIISSSANKLVATIKIGGHPRALVEDETNHRLYVADAKDSSVTTIDLRNRRVIKRLQIKGQPYSLAIDSGHRVFAATMGPTPYVEVSAQ